MKCSLSAAATLGRVQLRRVALAVVGAAATLAICIGAPAMVVASPAPQDPPEVGSLAKKAPPGLQEYILKAMKAWDVPGLAIAVVQDDKIVYAQGFGVRNSETREPVNEATIFGIGSITKSFTATSLAMLADEGKVKWDAPVKDYVPDFQAYDPYVTSVLSVRDIACHRTGIRDANYLQWRPTDRADNAEHPTRKDIVAAYRYLPPSEGFRTVFAYKNDTWEIAGAVVEAVTGQTWDRFEHERIFAPLGMTRSSTSVNETDALDNVSAVHVRVGGRLKPVPLVNADVPGPMGSINSTALDLIKYIRFHMGDGTFGNRRLLSAAGLAELHEPQIIDHNEWLTTGTGVTQQPSYALGWWVQDYRGLKLIHHSGAIVGGNANVAYIPERHLGVAVLVNTKALELVRAISLRALDAYLHAPAYDWNARALELERGNAAKFASLFTERAKARVPDTTPSLPLENYTGVYHNGAYGDLHISVDNGKMTARLWTFTGEMSHWNYDTFSFAWDERHYYLHVIPERQNLVRFDLDERGVPSHVQFLSLGLFTRIAPSGDTH
jgi:CubicO group peptidase (beta-lactamase class C family)